MTRSALRALVAAPVVALLAALLLLALPAAAQPVTPAADSPGSKCLAEQLGPAGRERALSLFRQYDSFLREGFTETVWAAAGACGAIERDAALAVLLPYTGRVQAQVATERFAAAGISAARLHSVWAGLPQADRDFAMRIGARMTSGVRPPQTDMDRLNEILGTYAIMLGVTKDHPASKHLVSFLAGHFMSGDPI